MKRACNDNGTQMPKRRKFQQSIKSMFLRSGPTFIEGPGIQPICRYCKRKFKAPQGLQAHRRMHERLGDYPVLQEIKTNVDSDSPPSASSHISLQPPNDKIPGKNIVKTELRASCKVPRLMTRRFTVAEKLRIIEKFKELENISATCRWVKHEYRRETFARKSLREMIEKESVLRSAKGTKYKSKTVRVRSGHFHRMDKKLAE